MDVVSSKAKSAFQAVSARAEWVLSEIKADFKAVTEPLTSFDSQSSGSKVGDLPWVTNVEQETIFEAELKRRILEITKMPEEYLLKHYDESLSIDMRAAMASAEAVLEVDQELRKLRSKLVPRRIKEEEFWRRYFLAVNQIKQEVLKSEEKSCSETEIKETLSLQKSKLVSGKLKPSVSLKMEKDDQEEEAYKDAYDSIQIMPFSALKKLANAVSEARCYRTIEELANQEEGGLEPSLQATVAAAEKLTNSIKNSVGAGIAVLGSLSGREREKNKDKQETSDHVVEDKKQRRKREEIQELNMLFQALFARDNESLKEKKEELGEEKAQKTSVGNTRGIIEAIHGAPAQSFVAELAETIAGLKNERKMAIFWQLVVEELKSCWKEGKFIPLVPVESTPDLRTCLLNQNLELLNCCMSRQKRRELALSASLGLLSVVEGSEPRVLKGKGEFSDTKDQNLEGIPLSEEDTASPEPFLFAKSTDGLTVRRLGAHKPVSNFRLLETGEVMYAPICQEGPVLTEVLIREEEERIQRTGSSGTGYSQLLSDMQAFKAANPGCILEDFVRWYSPLDWVEYGTLTNGVRELEAEEMNGKSEKEKKWGGSLSPRMLAAGNVWQQLWNRAVSIPSIQQAPLFDMELSAESALNSLSTIAPSDLFEQLFISAIGAGFSAALSTPQASKEPLSTTLKDCTDFVVSTCTRGMSDAKLHNLCQVYEIMETAVKTPPESEDDNILKKLTSSFFRLWKEEDHRDQEEVADVVETPTKSSKKFGFSDILEATPWGRQDSNKGSKKWSKETEVAWEEILMGSSSKSKGKKETSKKDGVKNTGSECDPTWTII